MRLGLRVSLGHLATNPQWNSEIYILC
jgi:hypothetical protein